MTDSATQRKKRYKQGGLPLAMAVSKQPVMWKTPIASDGSNRKFYRNSRGEPNLSGMVKLWPTPKATDYKGSGPTGSKSAGHDLKHGNLKGVVMFATPQARDYRTGQAERWENPERSRNLNDQIANSESGQLNPDWVEWLMGFPFGWTDPEREVDKSTMSKTGHWLPEPDIPRIAVGVKDRVNRLKCLGNAVVPQQFYPVFWAIAEIEKGESQ